jgi:hypothetical protein
MRPYTTFLRKALPETGKAIDHQGVINKLVAGQRVVLSRSLCAFRSRPLGGLNAERRLIEASILEALSASAFADPGIYVTIDPDVGVLNVWTWDRDLVETKSGESSRFVVPETLLHQPVEGFALRRCLDGVEGQLWRKDVLVGSRWWIEPPSDRDWETFYRSMARFADGLPEACPPLRDATDLDLEAPSNRLPLARQLREYAWSDFALIALAIASIAPTYHMMRNAAIFLEMGALSDEYATLLDTTVERRKLRRDLTSLSQEIETYKETFRENAPLAPLEASVAGIVRSGGDVMRISYNEGRIDLTFIAQGDVFERGVVEALEDTRILKDVSVQKQGQTPNWTVKASVVAPLDGNGE